MGADQLARTGAKFDGCWKRKMGDGHGEGFQMISK
jgi:hypothetical protein